MNSLNNFTRICIIAFLLIASLGSKLYSQINKSFNYQAVFYDNTNTAVSNKNISIRAGIISSNNTELYTEIHTPLTNPYGAINIVIGKGTAILGSFDNINWLSDKLSLKIECDITGGSNYSLFAVSPFLSVPYSMYAIEALHPSLKAGTGIGVDNSTNTVSNLKPDLPLNLNGTGTINISGTYPQFTLSNKDQQTLLLENDTLEITGGNSVVLPYVIKSDVCDATKIGALHYNAQLKLLEYCDGTQWNLLMPEKKIDNLKCSTSVPSNMDATDIEIYAGGTTFIEPDINGQFEANSNQFVVLNKTNGNIIYLNTLSSDTTFYTGDVFLNSMETAVTLLLYAIPFAFEPANQSKFESYKKLIRELPETVALANAIQASINNRGFLELDDTAIELKAAANRIGVELGYSMKKSLPTIPNNLYQGVRLKLDKASFDSNKLVWNCEFTVVNEWGCYLGVVPGKKINDRGYPIENFNPITYTVAPMNVSKFMGTFSTWSGLKSYFNDSKLIFTGTYLDEATWDKSKLSNIKINISANQDIVMILGAKDSPEILLYNLFMMFSKPIIKNIPGPRMAHDADFVQYYVAQFMKKIITDVDFMKMVYFELNNGATGYKKISLKLLDKFIDFLTTENAKIFMDAASDPGLWINDELAKKFLNSSAKSALLLKKTVEMVGDITLNIIGIESFNSFYFDINADIPAVLPVLSTQAVSDISLSSAKISAVISNDNGYPITARGICWSTSANPTIADNHTNNGKGLGSFIASISGLANSTKYFVRSYATNNAGFTNYGNQISFTTGQAITSPVLSTATISNIQKISAIAGGNITSDGGSDITTRGVCWSTSPDPNINNSFKTGGFGLGSFSCTITGLSPSTTYYVKAFATNSAGTGYGNEMVFTTLLEPAAPVVSTNAVSNINQTTATCGGNITSDSDVTITARGVCWSSSPNPTITNSKTTDGIGTGIFASSITGLTNNTKYYIRAYATNSIATSYGNEVSFTTGQPVTPPVLTTTAISNLTQTTAISGGNITSDGGGNVTARGVCWSTTPNPTTADSKTADGTGTGAFTSSLTGLTANTKYYVRAYATNSAGTSYGTEISFTTEQNIALPVLTTTPITNIAQTTATSGGNITSDGGASISARGVCWSTTPNPTIDNSKTTDGTGTGSFTSSLTGLTANTKYYVRAYATNSAGIGHGNEESFIPTRILEFGTVTDIEGNSYKTIQIGSQTWMAENLRVTKFNDGTQIENITENTLWINTKTPAYCWYSVSGIPINQRFGNLYNYYTIANSTEKKEVCPLGWHIPYDAEWETLQEYLMHIENSKDIHSVLKSPEYWDASCYGNNQYGFSALPAGKRIGNDGSFYKVEWGSFMMSKKLNSFPKNFEIWCNDSELYTSSENDGLSIRCLKNDGNEGVPSLLTYPAIAITSISAFSGGFSINDSGNTIISKGVCWNTSSQPTIDNNKSVVSPDSSSFISGITNLRPNTVYYIRAFATNKIGTGYGNEIIIKTNDSISYNYISDFEGNVYKTVKIGDQTWMAENLRSKKYSNGTPIVNVWAFDNNEYYAQVYGRLYDWNSAMNNSTLIGSQGACPIGWHIPSSDDWNKLNQFLQLNGFTQKDIALKSTSGWFYQSMVINGIDKYGFTALPSGIYYLNGDFAGMGSNGSLWTSNNYCWVGCVDAYTYNISNGGTLSKFPLKYGLSIRCIKN